MGSERSLIDYIGHGEHLMHLYCGERDRLLPIIQLLREIPVDHGILYLTDNIDLSDETSFSFPEMQTMSNALDDGRLKVLPSREMYCPGKKFDPWRVVDAWAGMIEIAKESCSEISAVAGEVEWLVNLPEEFPGLMEYESLINLFNLMSEFMVICQYSEALFHPDFLNHARSLHPMILANGQLERNYWMIQRRGGMSGLLTR